MGPHVLGALVTAGILEQVNMWIGSNCYRTSRTIGTTNARTTWNAGNYCCRTPWTRTIKDSSIIFRSSAILLLNNFTIFVIFYSSADHRSVIRHTSTYCHHTLTHWLKAAVLCRLLDLQLSEEQAGSPGYLSASQLASSSRLVALYAELYSHTRAQTLNSLHTLPELVSAQVLVCKPWTNEL